MVMTEEVYLHSFHLSVSVTTAFYFPSFLSTSSVITRVRRSFH